MENDKMNTQSLNNQDDEVSTSEPCLATSFVPAHRARPAFEKLLIGPLMILGEDLSGGHYLEVLRLAKQMAVGHNFGPSYWQLHSSLVAETGFTQAFFRGFMPWGLLQTVKGVPVLFVQHEANYQLTQYHSHLISPRNAEKVSGVLGGAAQAVFVCPLQKVKVAVIASPDVNNLGAFAALAKVAKTQGVLSLFDGLVPMMLRRSMDWGIRFGASSEVKNSMLARKKANGDLSANLNFMELVGCGLVGGACSAMTHPLDNVITNSQKPMPEGYRRDMVSVICRMAKESGMHAFTRGWLIKVADNSWHMAWMYGVGTSVYDFMQQALNRPVIII